MKSHYFNFNVLRKTLKINFKKGNASVGIMGEKIAQFYLKNNGFKIIKVNYKEGNDEIDIIGKSRDGTLIFFEVKTLLNIKNGAGLSPEDNFTKAKHRKIMRICILFSLKNEKMIKNNRGWRIDLLAITQKENAVLINHYENV